jgi:hypothetical protein
MVLITLSAVLGFTDPAAAAEAARTAAGHLRQAGHRVTLTYAIMNLVTAMVLLGDWDAAAEELTQVVDSGGLVGIEHFAAFGGWLAALRGDAAAAEALLAGMPALRVSESPQDQAVISVAEAFAAAAGRPQDALRCARATLAHAGALGLRHEALRWAWPLAARSAYELDDTAAARELLSQLDSHPPGHLAPMLRAERDLAHARLAARNGDPAATELFAAAISRLREHSTPYHLAHGLLAHAQHLRRAGDHQAAVAAIGEARDIAQRLRCDPLLDRAASLGPAKTQARISTNSAPIQMPRRHSRQAVETSMIIAAGSVMIPAFEA